MRRGRPEQVTREFLERCVQYETTRRAAANVLGVTVQTVAGAEKRHGIRLRLGTVIQAPLRAPDRRAIEMADLYKAGETLEQIGQRHGITRERVRQIISETFG